MANRQRELDAQADRLQRRVRARVLRHVIAEADPALDAEYGNLARRIRDRLGIDASESQVATVLRQEFERIGDRVLPIVIAEIENGAAGGHESASQLLRLLERAQEPGAGPFDRPSASTTGEPSRSRRSEPEGSSDETG